MLNFRDIYKEIINPYFIYPNTRYAIANEGNHQESIKVTFQDSKHFIIFQFDRIVFQHDCTLGDLEGKSNHIDMCFEILKKIKDEKTFTRFDLEVLEVIFFEDYKETEEKIVSKFNKFFNLDFSNYKPMDSSIIIEKTEKRLKSNIQFGPFNPVNIENLSLFSMDDQRKSEYKDKTGVIVKCAYYNKPDEITLSTYKSLVKKAIETSKDILKNYE